MGGGAYADLVFAKLDFSNGIRHGIEYSYAHAQSTGFDNNRLQVLVSTDCGATWNLESQLMGTALATAPSAATTAFYPTATTWATDTVDLSAYDGNADVMIAFKGICAGGNNLYIDDIRIGEEMIISGISENSTEDIIANIYPNPTSNIANLQLSIKKTMNLEIGVYDVLGKKVQQIDNAKFSNGIHNISFDTSNLENGTYFIKYQSNEMVNNVKFVVAH